MPNKPRVSESRLIHNIITHASWDVRIGDIRIYAEQLPPGGLWRIVETEYEFGTENMIRRRTFDNCDKKEVRRLISTLYAQCHALLA